MSGLTREEVVRMAREAWRETGEGWTVDAWFDSRAASFERFAAMAYAAGQAAEREACIEDVRTVGGRFAVECEAMIHSRGKGEAL